MFKMKNKSSRTWSRLHMAAKTISQTYLVFLLFAVQHKTWAQKIIFMSGGLERNFILHLPKSAKEKDSLAYPVILCLHGKGSNGREMKMYTGLNKTGDEMNSIIAYPTTTDEAWPWADTSTIRKEANYLLDVIHYITSHFNGNPDQVYMTGMSSGGIFTFTFTSLYPSVLKGIAVVSGNITLMAKNNIEKNASLLPPLLLIHGTGDDLLYNGREGMCLGAEDSFATYMNTFHVRSPVIELMTDLKKDKCTVEKITYDFPENKIYYKIINGGHHWPGATFNAALFTSLKLGKFCRDFKANEAIRNFILGISGK